jgi:uncharacterized membrane protein YgdD (TMEM256/DUF423 family)
LFKQKHHMIANPQQVVAGILGFLVVGLGAFGAHGLSGLLAERQMMGVWQTAVFYHALHAVVLVVRSQRERVPSWGDISFIAGIAFFSGSLYVMALTGWRGLGIVTPVGGLLLLAGWAGLIYEGWMGKGGK